MIKSNSRVKRFSLNGKSAKKHKDERIQQIREFQKSYDQVNRRRNVNYTSFKMSRINSDVSTRTLNNTRSVTHENTYHDSGRSASKRVSKKFDMRRSNHMKSVPKRNQGYTSAIFGSINKPNSDSRDKMSYLTKCMNNQKHDLAGNNSSSNQYLNAERVPCFYKYKSATKSDSKDTMNTGHNLSQLSAAKLRMNKKRNAHRISDILATR